MMSTTTAAIRLGQLRHALLVGCLLSGSAGAETLQQAWEAALTADRGVRAAQQNTAAAASLVQAAEAARLPGVSLEAGYTALDNAPTSRVELGGASQQFAVAQRESYAYRAMATLPLYTGGRITSGIEASKASLNAARYGEAGEMQELKLRVAEAFTTVLRTTQGLAVANSHVASLQAHATDVQNLFEQGVVARNDLLAAQVALADARQQAIRAANAVDITRAAYNRLLGRPLDQGVTLDEISPETTNEPLPTVAERALRQRPELGALADQIRALRHQATAVRAETAPQVALSGGYGYQENRYQVYPGQWSATLGARWNLFDGGMANHRADAVNRQEAALQERRDDFATVIELQVRQAWLDIQETRKRVEVTQSAIAQAEENLRVNRDRYANGLATNTEVLTAETLRLVSRNNHVNALYDAVLAGLRLKRAAGEI